jgi:hypothetical protein
VKYKDKFNPLEGVDYSVLGDPDFKEDSVREEIISPILKSLGYSPSKPNRIIRSKSLEHPFVSIGSARKKIKSIPDYLLEVNDQYAWILEAKSPSEDIINSKHVEQAYSYAIHSEIRVPIFGLCNGKEFVLYHVSNPKPLIHFSIIALPSYWENLIKLLSPSTVLEYDFKLAKDFGLHLHRLGFQEFSSIIFPDVPIPFIAQIDENEYTFSAGTKTEEGDSYVASFDFDRNILKQFEGKIPDKAFKTLLSPFDGNIKNVLFTDRVYYVTIDSRVGSKLVENSKEIFSPLAINRVL